MAFRILLPRPGIKPMPPAVKVQSLNHWTAREVPAAWMFSAHSKLVRRLPLLFTNEETEAGVPPPTPTSVQPGALSSREHFSAAPQGLFGASRRLPDPRGSPDLSAPPASKPAKAKAGLQGRLDGSLPKAAVPPPPPQLLATYQPGPDPLGELLIQGEDVTTLHRQLGPILELHLPRGMQFSLWPTRPSPAPTHSRSACRATTGKTTQGHPTLSLSLG